MYTGMFISPEKSPLHWFNAASTDTDSEFHLIGMVSNMFKHVHYCKFEASKENFLLFIKLVMKILEKHNYVYRLKISLHINQQFELIPKKGNVDNNMICEG